MAAVIGESHISLAWRRHPCAFASERKYPKISLEHNQSMSAITSKLSEAQLNWFSLDNYPIEKIRLLSLREWESILEFRIYLNELASSDPASALERFDPIKSTPLRTDNISILQLSARAAADQGSVRQLRVSEVNSMSKFLRDVNAQPTACYDHVHSEEIEVDVNYFRHIKVDLRTKKSQIAKDFKNWLDQVHGDGPKVVTRVYEEKRHMWANNLYLPCYDLLLYAKIRGQTIAGATLFDVLRLGDNEKYDDLPTALEKVKTCLTTFTRESVDALRIEAGGYR